MRVLLLCLFAAACASTPQRQSAGQRLLAGAPVAAPEGVYAYCAQRPQQCAADAGAPDDDLRGRVEATGAASLQRLSYDGRARASMFEAMLAARASRVDLSALSGRAEMMLTQARWNELRRVNRDINRAIQPATDRAAHGVEELWSMPLSDDAAGGARGDCEDYALEKRARLIALGWPQEMLALAVAHAPGVGLHAVLVAQTDAGDFVLDNLHGEPQPLSRLGYVWLSRQSGPSLSTWAAAHAGEAAPTGVFERAMRERMLAARAQAPQTPVLAELAAPTPQSALQRERLDAVTLPPLAPLTAPLTMRAIEIALPQLARVREPKPGPAPAQPQKPHPLLASQRALPAAWLSQARPAGRPAAAPMRKA